MNIDTVSGLLTGVVVQSSPHQDPRPTGVTIDMIVVHGISLPPGIFGGDAITDFFCGRLNREAHPYFAEIAPLKVSAHLLIDRHGQVIQFVPFTARAWHAGASVFQGRERCNDFSIGIELEGTDDTPYTEQQYQTLAAVIRLLQQVYPTITKERIVGHSDVAPGRKTDPGQAFAWDYLTRMLES